MFGWEPNDLDMGGVSYTEWKLGDKTIAGMMTMPDMVPAEVPAHWLVYFGVADTEATVANTIETQEATTVFHRLTFHRDASPS